MYPDDSIFHLTEYFVCLFVFTILTICVRTDRLEQTVLNPDELPQDAASHQAQHVCH